MVGDEKELVPLLKLNGTKVAQFKIFKSAKICKLLIFLARAGGFEPPTLRSEV